MTRLVRVQPKSRSKSRSNSRSSWRRLSDGIVILIESFVEARRLRLAVRKLHQLDDRMLADIGIARGGIEAAVRGAKPTRVETGSTPPEAMAA